MFNETNNTYSSSAPGASMYSYPQAPGPALARVETNFSTMSSESRCSLVDHEESSPPTRSRRYSLPLFQNPSGFSRTSNHSGDGDHGGSFGKRRFQLEGPFKGWRTLLLGSWLNVLFFLIPVAWTFSVTLPHYHALVFVFSLLALIPLIKMHEVTTRDLAIRIGGSKTGLLNASLSNTVEIVVAFSALRKCELRVVQSSLIGSILAKLLLVLGLCFFAGGMRFSEQGFDATANQVHSSLLSISVGVVLLPAAYHFALSGGKDESMPAPQQRSILNMSHGVSLILIAIYTLYLLFQLVSHTHLYKDTHRKSRRLSINVPVPLQTPMIFQTLTGMRDKGKVLSPSSSASSDYDGEESASKWLKGARVRSSATPPSLSPSPSQSRSNSPARQIPIQPGTPYVSRPYGFPDGSEITLTNSGGIYPAINSTVRLIDGPDAGGTAGLASRSASRTTSMTESSRSFSGSTINSQYHPGLALDTECLQSEKFVDVPIVNTPSREDQSPVSPNGSVFSIREPQLSWFLTTLALIFVTISVAFTADWLVEAMDGISTTISKEWVALILLPAVSAIAECGTAIGVSVEDQLTLSISVAVGSSIQTALFVIPFMVTAGWVMGKPLALLFDPFESLVLYLSVQTMTHVVADGKSNWLEGAILIGLYIIIAVSFWFYPGSNLPSALAVCTT